MGKIEVLMEEYKAIRDEVVLAIKMQQSVLRYALATLGLLFAAAFGIWDKFLPSAIIFLLFVPIVCYFSLITWVGEVGRMMRSGRHIKTLEERVNSLLEDDVLTWETSLRIADERGRTSQMEWNYFAPIALLLSLPILSVIFGAIQIWSHSDTNLLIAVTISEITAFALAFFITLKTCMPFRSS